MSYIVVVYEGDYPDGKDSKCTLLGSYHTRSAARFISEVHKRRNKLEFYPRIMESDVPPDFPEANILEENLKLLKIKEIVDKKFKKINKSGILADQQQNVEE